MAYSWDLERRRHVRRLDRGEAHLHVHRARDVQGRPAVSLTAREPRPRALRSRSRPGTPRRFLSSIPRPPALHWTVGQTIPFSGHATDRQDGTEPASRLSWSLLIHHCPSDCHIHPFENFDNVASGSFSGPDHEYPAFLELRLTARDANGLSETTSVELDPQTVDLTFVSDPTGMQLTAGTALGSAPFTARFIVGGAVSLGAPNQTLSGTEYVLSSWSDDGAQIHTVTVPGRPHDLQGRVRREESPADCRDHDGKGERSGSLQGPARRLRLDRPGRRPARLLVGHRPRREVRRRKRRFG